MAGLTEKSLKELGLNLQTKTNSVNTNLVDELHKMRKVFDQMKLDLSFITRVNT